MPCDHLGKVSRPNQVLVDAGSSAGRNSVKSAATAEVDAAESTAGTAQQMACKGEVGACSIDSGGEVTVVTCDGGIPKAGGEHGNHLLMTLPSSNSKHSGQHHAGFDGAAEMRCYYGLCCQL